MNSQKGADASLFFLIYVISAICAGVLTSVTIGLDLAGMELICCPHICILPIAFGLFLFPAFAKRVKPFHRYLFPGLIFPILFGILLGNMIYEQSPKVMFKRLLGDPIPSGVTNIRSDIYTDLSYYERMAFDATPEAIDELIARNNLILVDDFECGFSPPFRTYPEINKDQDWFCYTIASNDHEDWGALFVNADKTVALFHFHVGH